MTNNLIENTFQCIDVVKIYEGKAINTTALRGITCMFETGKIYSVLGPSGSGKTTLLNLLAGIISPSSGEIIFKDQKYSDFDNNGLENFRLNNISYILQEPIFIDYLKVEENIQFGFELKNKTSSKEEVEKILAVTNLSHKNKSMPFELSGGEKQRLSIAISLAIGNQIFLCDEPTGELDSENKTKIALLLKKIARENPNIIMIIVTHDPLFIQYSDQILVIEDGRIKQKLSQHEYNEINKGQKINDEGSMQFTLKKNNILNKIEELKNELSNM